MFVVRRSFRNYGHMMAPGSVVEPGAIKRFKSLLNDGHIVEVPEQDFDKWDRYFKERIGVAIQIPAEPEEPDVVPETEQVTKPVKPTAKAVAKATSK